MSAYIDVTISCRVWDAQALWDRAVAHLEGEGIEYESIMEMLGTRINPQVDACLIMLLGAGRVAAWVVEEPGVEAARDEIERLRAEARDARAALAAICP